MTIVEARNITVEFGKVVVGKLWKIHTVLLSPHQITLNVTGSYLLCAALLPFSAVTELQIRTKTHCRFTNIIMRLLLCCPLACLLAGTYPVSAHHLLSWEAICDGGPFAEWYADELGYCIWQGGKWCAATSPCSTSHYLGHLVDSGIIINLHWAAGLSSWQAKWLGRKRGWISVSYNVVLKWVSMEFNGRLWKHN